MYVTRNSDETFQFAFAVGALLAGVLLLIIALRSSRELRVHKVAA